MTAARCAVALAAVVLGVATACGDDDDGTAGAAAPEDTVQVGPVAATEVVVGDCLDGIVIGAAERREITSARVVPCEGGHDFEVYATFGMDAAELGVDDPMEYPGRARVVRAADEGCTHHITELLDDPQTYGLLAMWPSETSWATGDRQVACAVFSRDGGPFEQRQL